MSARTAYRTPRAALCCLLAVLSVPTVALAGNNNGNGNGDAENGRIVWSRFTDETFGAARIVSAEPDGSRLRVLSSGPDATQDIDPVPSPDGKLIVFERDNPTGTSIELMRADGRQARTIGLGCTDPCALDLTPGWTPDAEHITFTRVIGPFDEVNGSARSAVLQIADRDGANITRLSEPGIDGIYEDYRARYSPDGRTITFVRVRNADLRSAVFAMAATGENVRQLTPWDIDADLPDLSQARRGPTRGLVVFETFGHGPPPGASQDIATVPTDCVSLAACTTQIHYLTNNGAGPTTSANPGWSPDGSRVTFSEWTDTAFADIWTMNPDGTDRRRVSTSTLWDFRPSWGAKR
jgi:Tol biopolymer transport system component